MVEAYLKTIIQKRAHELFDLMIVLSSDDSSNKPIDYKWYDHIKDKKEVDVFTGIYEDMEKLNKNGGDKQKK